MARILSHAQWEAHQRLHGRAAQRERHPVEQQPVALGGLSLAVPLPPSVNDLYGVGANGQKFLLPEQREFRNTVIRIARIGMRGAPPFAGRLEVWVTLHFANRRRTDISNRVKAVEDALTHALVYNDDSQIDDLHVKRIVDPDAPEFCAVHIREPSK